MEMIAIDPGRLDVGAPAAERDIKRGLDEYFIESDAFNRVRRAEKLVILGNRGAGKSAIFRVLARRERAAGTHVIELAPEDYSYELLSRTMLPEHSGSWAKLGAYAVAWKYLIYVLVMHELTRARPALRRGTNAAIYRYVRDNHVGGSASKLSALVSYLKRLEGVKVGPYEASLRTRELEKLYKLAEVAPLLSDLKRILQEERVVVLVDELDRGWDASEDAKAFVAGLFQACVSINELSDNLRVYISLRQELYDNIPSLYEDAQKFRDLIEVIRWDEMSLLQLIAARVRHSLPALADASDQRCWNVLFAKRAPEADTNSFHYMIDRTLYRPREIIQFCAQALEEACRAGKLPIDAATLRSAELAYSEERTRDLAAEFRFQYPGLLNVFEVFRGIDPHFEREELELRCLEIATERLLQDEADTWVTDRDPDELIAVLWRIGFLQAWTVGSARADRDAGSFLGPYQVGNPNLRAVRRFRVHPMFWAHLALGEAPRPPKPGGHGTVPRTAPAHEGRSR